jgi:16S rRNA (guanine527-N7)-methyltransferase
MTRGTLIDKSAPLELLRAGCDALLLPVEPRQLDLLLAYLRLLSKWNQVHNLTAIRDPGQMVVQHLLDCLAAVAPIGRDLPADGVRVLDVGSGAGLPGVVLAVLRPRWSIVCVDAVAKKAMFIRQAAAELSLPNLQAEHARVENFRARSFDRIVSRAFASLGDFARLTRRSLADGGNWVAMKGQVPDTEIAALTADVEVFHVEPLEVPGLPARRCLVWMRPR